MRLIMRRRKSTGKLITKVSLLKHWQLLNFVVYFRTVKVVIFSEKEKKKNIHTQCLYLSIAYKKLMINLYLKKNPFHSFFTYLFIK